MLECLKFIFSIILEFLYMLFDIDIGFTSLGTLMCVTFIFLPMVLTIINFIKQVVIDEFDERHDYERIFGRHNNNYNPRHGYKPRHAEYVPRHAKKK